MRKQWQSTVTSSNFCTFFFFFIKQKLSFPGHKRNIRQEFPYSEFTAELHAWAPWFLSPWPCSQPFPLDLRGSAAAYSVKAISHLLYATKATSHAIPRMQPRQSPYPIPCSYQGNASIPFVSPLPLHSIFCVPPRQSLCRPAQPWSGLCCLKSPIVSPCCVLPI